MICDKMQNAFNSGQRIIKCFYLTRHQTLAPQGFSDHFQAISFLTLKLLSSKQVPLFRCYSQHVLSLLFLENKGINSEIAVS